MPTNVLIHGGLYGTIQLGTDYCGQLQQKYVTVRTIQFCRLQCAELYGPACSVKTAILFHYVRMVRYCTFPYGNTDNLPCRIAWAV